MDRDHPLRFLAWKEYYLQRSTLPVKQHLCIIFALGYKKYLIISQCFLLVLGFMSPAHATGAQHPQLAIASSEVSRPVLANLELPVSFRAAIYLDIFGWHSHRAPAGWRGPGKSKNLREKKQEFDGDMIGI